MSEKISLKEMERKAFTTTFQDGLWDILIGCLMLEFAIAPLLSVSLGDFWSSAVFLPFWGVVYLAVWLIRKNVVKQRVGEVKFGKTRRTRLLRFNIVILVINIALLIIGIFVAFKFNQFPLNAPLTILGFVFLILFSLAAYFLDFRRLYIYGLLTGFAPLVGEWLYSNRGATHHGFPITFGFTSGLMILIGVILFIRFLYNNPVIQAET